MRESVIVSLRSTKFKDILIQSHKDNKYHLLKFHRQIYPGWKHCYIRIIPAYVALRDIRYQRYRNTEVATSSRSTPTVRSWFLLDSSTKGVKRERKRERERERERERDEVVPSLETERSPYLRSDAGKGFSIGLSSVSNRYGIIKLAAH